MTSIGSYGKLQICPPDGTTCHGHAYISWTDIGHAHNEDNDEDKKKFNKLNTKSYTIVVTHWLFLHLLGACAPNNLKPVTIFHKFYTIVVTHWLFYIFWGHVRLIIWNLLPFSLNDEDKKNFNKLNTKFYTIVVTHWLFLHLLGACAPNNLKPVTIFYGLIPDNAIKSPSLVKHATEKTIHIVLYDTYTYVLCCSE